MFPFSFVSEWSSTLHCACCTLKTKVKTGAMSTGDGPNGPRVLRTFPHPVNPYLPLAPLLWQKTQTLQSPHLPLTRYVWNMKDAGKREMVCVCDGGGGGGGDGGRGEAWSGCQIFIEITSLYLGWSSMCFSEGTVEQHLVSSEWTQLCFFTMPKFRLPQEEKKKKKHSFGSRCVSQCVCWEGGRGGGGGGGGGGRERGRTSAMTLAAWGCLPWENSPAIGTINLTINLCVCVAGGGGGGACVCVCVSVSVCVRASVHHGRRDQKRKEKNKNKKIAEDQSWIFFSNL